jgi:hypothetical protein
VTELLNDLLEHGLVLAAIPQTASSGDVAVPAA